jgi:hypothetical protein
MPKEQRITQLTVLLSDDVVNALEQTAKDQGITMTEALSKAIMTESYMRRELKNKSKVLIRKSNRTFLEVIFP